MFGLRRFGIKLGLETIKNILQQLGSPQDKFSCIHIAGTNGKGSIASALSSILHASGYKVGLYTSPHLVKFNERICINNKPVSDKEIVASYEAVKKASPGKREPTFFEFATAMALFEFARQKVDWAIIETGMGGRLDATNIIKPKLAVITNISLEHQEYLGNTIAEITGEKGGIIKPGIPVITGVKQKNGINVLKKIVREKSARLYILGDDFRVRRTRGAFTYFGIENVWRDMKKGLMGKHQVENSALALAACEALSISGQAVLPLKSIKKGLEENRWAGRLEKVSDSPVILLDGAHNLSAARTLANFLSKKYAEKKITLVLGILDDKPYLAMLASLLPVCSKAVLTKPVIDRALEPKILCEAAKKIIPDAIIIPDAAKAVKYAVETASQDDVICIAGSLYVVGEAKEALEKILETDLFLLT